MNSNDLVEDDKGDCNMYHSVFIKEELFSDESEKSQAKADFLNKHENNLSTLIAMEQKRKNEDFIKEKWNDKSEETEEDDISKPEGGTASRAKAAADIPADGSGVSLGKDNKSKSRAFRGTVPTRKPYSKEEHLPAATVPPQKKCRQSYQLTEAEEELMLEWLPETPAVWRRGHKHYKDRMTFFHLQAEKMGTGRTGHYLEGWWKNRKDWYVRLMRTKAKFGSGTAGTKKLTDREQAIVDRFTFYRDQLRSVEGESEPMTQFPRSDESASSSRTLPEMENAEDKPVLNQLRLRQPLNLEGIEASASVKANSRYQESSKSILTSMQSRFKRKHGEADDTLEVQLGDLIALVNNSSQLMTQLIQQRQQAMTLREPFINYIGDTLRNLSDAQFQQARVKLSAVLHDMALVDSKKPDQFQ